MIYCINIKNIALISEAQIEFSDGFNVITGETGAGKSVLIDSINMLLGERIGKDIIRLGEKSAEVSAVFYVKNESTKKLLAELGITLDDSGELVISREIHEDGKNICKVNGSLVNVSFLKQIGHLLINIHGQHNNQALLNPSKHINILDSFADDSHLNNLSEFKKLYNEMTRIRKKLSEAEKLASEKERRIDILNYEINEIKTVNPISGEDAELKRKKQVFDNKKKLISSAGAALYLLYENTDGESAYQLLAKATDALNDATAIDGTLLVAQNAANEALIHIQDAAREIRSYIDSTENDSLEDYDIDARLDELYKLKRKYGDSIDEVINYLSEREEELYNISTSEKQIEELHAQLNDINKILNEKANKISLARKKTAKRMEKEITESIRFLNMTNALFEVSIKEKDISADGIDEVEFMLVTINGEQPKPLTKIASGGELSRIMLAMKSVLADCDDTHTLIFDEIDSGVSGRAAQKIGEKMKMLSSDKQIFCVTHLAQIASVAETHFLVEKIVENSTVTAYVKPLSNEDRKYELARIISGENITETTLKQAEEMLS